MAAQEEYTTEQAAEDIGDLRGQVDRLNEILQVTDGGLTPNTPAAGTYAMYSSAGAPTYLNPQGMGGNLSAATVLSTSPVTVTAASATDIGDYAIASNDPQVGSIYKLHCIGYGTQAGTSATTLQFSISHGGVNGGSAQLGTTFFNAGQTFRFWGEVVLICVTTGTPGSFLLYGRVNITEAGSNITNLATGQQAAGFAIGLNTGTISVNTTAQETIRLQVAWGTTTGAPTLTCVASWGEKVA